MTVLQIAEKRELFRQLVLRFGEDTYFRFPAHVAIPLVAGRYILCMLDPGQPAIMSTVVEAVETSEGKLERFLLVIHPNAGHIKIVLHQLAANEVGAAVGLLPDGLRLQPEVAILPVIAVVLIVSISMVVTDARVEGEITCQLPGEGEL